MIYSFNCPTCEHVVSGDAENDEDAITKINDAHKAHRGEVHADMPQVPDEEMKNTIKIGMYKEETF